MDVLVVGTRERRIGCQIVQVKTVTEYLGDNREGDRVFIQEGIGKRHLKRQVHLIPVCPTVCRSGDAGLLQKDIEAQYRRRVREMEARLKKARQPEDKVFRTGGEVTVPAVITRVQPAYTDEARDAGTQGVVIVEAVIDEHGDVSQVRVLKGLPNGLDTAAADAVKQWKFTPATLHGKPVAVYFTVTVTFRVDSRPRPD